MSLTSRTQRYLWLDWFRGLSALAVCAGHLRAALFQDFGEARLAGLLLKPLYFATGLGHQAVMVFFVLSGFFVGGSVLNKAERFSFRDYSLARITRLWIVLVPALLMTSSIDLLISRYHPEVLQGALRETWNSGPEPGLYSNSITTLLANLFFLQTIAAPVFGTNSPVWSLANEFWYYVCSPSNGQALARKFGRALSEISYSLYLTHFPIIALLTAFVFGSAQFAPSAAALPRFTLVLTFLVACGSAFWFLFESPTESLRNLFRSHWIRFRRPADALVPIPK